MGHGRIARGEVVVVTRPEIRFAFGFECHGALAVELQLVQPVRPIRQFARRQEQHWIYECRFACHVNILSFSFRRECSDTVTASPIRPEGAALLATRAKCASLKETGVGPNPAGPRRPGRFRLI